ncbi:TPA: BppU family phage baseplate upper protein, partial [Enterococcus faecium]|nr:BppU family phage baseplate upper protein [Enterococcus faecium]
PFITKNLITESFLNGQVVYILPEAMKAYNGMVEAYVYIEYPDGSTSDNLGFTFRMKRSAIDGLAQDKADYFIADFQQLLDGVKQEATDAVNEALAKVEAVSKNVSSAQNDLTILEDRIDQTNQQIGDLGKLKKMYSNSIDFGGYDYSGNPNLMANINADSFSQGTGALSVVDDGDEVVVTLDPNHKLELFKAKSQPNLLIGKTYTMSVEIMLEDDFTGDPSKIGLRYTKMPNWVSELYTRNTLTTAKGVWQKLTGAVKITATSDNAESWFIMLQNKDANNSLSGKLRLRHAKVEYGSTATPYQPNLFDAPYYLSKAALGENIANKSVTFPIKSSDYAVYDYKNIENFVVGEKYVATIKATKHATQVFEVRNTNSYGFGAMKPVEGLTDIWVLEFTPTRIDAASPSSLQIYQSPKNTKGAVQIDWLKIEKGDTRTPNISQFKYFGEGLKDSNNPNDYSWDVTPEYTEKSLNNTVSLTEPQSIEGLKNFEDGIQSKGKSVLTSDDNKYEVVTLTVTNGNTGSAKLYREGKTVTIYFFALNGKSSGGNDSTILTIPEGYRPPISFEQLVGSIDRSTLNSAQLSIGADGAIKWRRNSSYGSDYTFAITYTI